MIHSNLSQATKNGVDQLSKHHGDQERRKIEDWLFASDFAAQQSDFNNRRQEGTGQWLINSNEFKNWLDGTEKTLFCSGIPGAGKTILTSLVIDELWKRFQANIDVGIAHLYCSYKTQEDQKFGVLVASLLKQLVRRLPILPDNIANLYKHHIKGGTRPLDDEITTALHLVAGSYSRTFFVIDALDECISSDGTRNRLLDEIFKCQSDSTAAFFATSRLIPEITSSFEGRTSISIRASDDDVRMYLDNHITQLPKFVLRDQALQVAIKVEIIKASDGM